MKTFGSLLALFTTAAATVLAFAGTASADTMSVAYADLDGDHRIDRVTLTQNPDNPNDQILVGTVNRTSYVKHMPIAEEPGLGVLPLRVVDLDRDGRQEVVVTELVGANTAWFGVWYLGKPGVGWKSVQAESGGSFELYEGGGIREISRYGCREVGGHRELVLLSAQIQDPWEDELYAGALVSYTVRDGVARWTSGTEVSGDRGTLTRMAVASECV
jgi:hypothetical protein